MPNKLTGRTPSGRMVNFRARNDAQIVAIDQMAKQVGMSRSDWLRAIVDQALDKGENAVPRWARGSQPVVPQPEPPPASVVDRATCPHPDESRRFIPGVNLTLCTVCGARFHAG